jgi:hypothetical protein
MGVMTMDSKMSTFWMAVAAAIALWLLGGLILSKELGMICVILGITIVGVAGGSVMNSPCTTSKND